MKTDKPQPDALPVPPRTPLAWRLGIVLAVVALAGAAYWCRGLIGLRGQAGVGALCFLGIAAACSAHLRAVNWRTILWGMALQVLLALFVMKTDVGKTIFGGLANVVAKF